MATANLIELISDGPTHRSLALTGLAAEQGLHELVLDLCLDTKVLDYLLPHGSPHANETSLWDY